MEASQVKTQMTPCSSSLPELEVPTITTLVKCLGSEHRKLDELKPSFRRRYNWSAKSLRSRFLADFIVNISASELFGRDNGPTFNVLDRAGFNFGDFPHVRAYL